MKTSQKQFNKQTLTFMPSLIERIFRRKNPYRAPDNNLKAMRTGLELRFCALVLAGGRGKRFDNTGKSDKLMASIGGIPALGHVISNLKTQIDDVLVVTRPGGNSAQIRQVAELFGAQTAICIDADSGMGHTLAWGTSQAASKFDPQAMIVCLGDMPFVSSTTIHALMRHVVAPDDVAVPKMNGRLGNPVAFGMAHFAALGQLAGDRGARQLLSSLKPTEVEMQDTGIFEDIDTIAELNQLVAKHHQ